MITLTVAVVALGTHLQDRVLVFLPVAELLLHSAQHLDSGVKIDLLLVFGNVLRDLDQTAGGNGTCRAVVALRLLGSAEVNDRKPIVGDQVGNEVMRDLLCGIEVLGLLRMNVGKNEAVECPCRTARPGRAEA